MALRLGNSKMQLYDLFLLIILNTTELFPKESLVIIWVSFKLNGHSSILKEIYLCKEWNDNIGYKKINTLCTDTIYKQY